MYLMPYRSPANLGYLGRAARRQRSRLRGLGDDALNYLPIGTQLVYNATYEPTLGGRSVQDVQNQLKPALAQIGISVIGARGTGPGIFGAGGLTLTLLLNQAYQTATMVQQSVDGQVGRFTSGVLTSNISVTAVPVGAPVTPTAAPPYPTTPVTGPGAGAAAEAANQGAAPSITDWLSNNWPWLALGGVGVFFLVKKL